MAPKLAYFGAVGLAVGMVVFAKADVLLFEKTRTLVTDAMMPILDVASRPVASVRTVVEEVRTLANIREENVRLRQDNATLLRWQSVAQHLQSENHSLRDLLNYVPGPQATYKTARVVADAGGTYAHSMILNAGSRDGIEKGQAVIVGEGLIGRITEVGSRASRVLLITDLNSKVPVTVEPSNARAILGGDNTNRPRLLHMPDGMTATPGDRVVTSGHAGAFPPGIAIGIVTSVSDGGIHVQPFASRERLEYVRVVDFGLKGILRSVELGTVRAQSDGSTAEKVKSKK